MLSNQHNYSLPDRLLYYLCNIQAENNVGILHKIRFLGQKPEISILTVHTLPTPPPQNVNNNNSKKMIYFQDIHSGHFQENDLFLGHT